MRELEKKREIGRDREEDRWYQKNNLEDSHSTFRTWKVGFQRDKKGGKEKVRELEKER